MQTCANCRHYERFDEFEGACHRIGADKPSPRIVSHDDEAFLVVASGFGCVLHEAGPNWTEAT